MLTDQRIHDLRAVITFVIRLVAGAMLAWGTVLLVRRLAFAAGSGSPQVVFRTWSGDLGESNSFYHALGLMVAGVLLSLLSGRLARWMLPAPTHGCAACGHAFGDDDEVTRCPECGRPRH